MTGSKQQAFALSIFCGMFTLAYAQQNPIETRGELLYSTNCAACHTSEIHWREKRLATDMDSLKFQVRRWQASIGLDWTEDEIADVASYLNAAYYGFQNVDQKGFLEEKKHFQALHKD
jgi:mono/diheme cytochrome c family protein